MNEEVAMGTPGSPERTRTFRNREEAGRLLAEEVAPLVAHPRVVAAIPRGGVEVALPIVERLSAPLTVIYARKLTAPIAPELAFGALDEDGQTIMDEEIISGLELSEAEVESAKRRVVAEITRRMTPHHARCRRLRPPPQCTRRDRRSLCLVERRPSHRARDRSPREPRN
jgi:putative phosphoribosyl transferase